MKRLIYAQFALVAISLIVLVVLALRENSFREVPSDVLLETEAGEVVITRQGTTLRERRSESDEDEEAESPDPAGEAEVTPGSQQVPSPTPRIASNPIPEPEIALRPDPIIGSETGYSGAVAPAETEY